LNFSIVEIVAAKATHRRLHARRVQRLRVRPRANPSKVTARPKATTFRSDF
jgi:hypothetical protein